MYRYIYITVAIGRRRIRRDFRHHADAPLEAILGMCDDDLTNKCL